VTKPQVSTVGSVFRTLALTVNWGSLLMVLLIGALGFYILYPMALILINSFNTATIGLPPVYSLEVWRQAFSDSDIWISLWNTGKIAFWRNILAFPVGVLIAWFLARTNVPFARLFEFLFWVSFMLPSLGIVYGWILLLDPNTGLVNTWLRQLPFLEGSPFNIYSFWGIIWVHFISGIDIKVMLLTPAFRRMDASMEEASQMSGASSLMTMFRITLPVMTPVLVVVFLLGVIRLLESFEIELLLGLPWGFYVYSTKIMDLALEEPPLVNQAAALGSVVLLLLAVIIPLQQWLIHARQYTTVTSRFKLKLVYLGKWRHAVTGAIGLVVFLAVGVPILSLLVGSFMMRFGFFGLEQTWTLEYWRMALTDPDLLKALKNTLVIAGSAALVGSLLFSLVAYILVRTRLPWRWVLDAICWIPSVIPGVLAGLGLLWMFLGVPLFRPAYGTLLLLVIASIMGGVTLSTQILKANFIQLGAELEEASRVAGAGFWRTYFSIVLRLMAPTMVMVGVLKFLFAARNVSSIILLATSESKTLSLLALEQIGFGYRETANVTVLLVVLLTTGIAIVVRSFGLKVGLQGE